MPAPKFAFYTSIHPQSTGFQGTKFNLKPDFYGIITINKVIKVLPYNISNKWTVMSSVNLAKRLKEIRVKYKITQDKLSKKADIPYSTLAKLESGYTSNPSMETLIKIADALGIGVDELLGRK